MPQEPAGVAIPPSHIQVNNSILQESRGSIRKKIFPGSLALTIGAASFASSRIPCAILFPVRNTYFETNTLGESVFSRGMVEGDTWTWTNESKMGGKPVRGRFTLKQLSADSATYKFELGSGDEPLKVIMEGKQMRVK